MVKKATTSRTAGQQGDSAVLDRTDMQGDELDTVDLEDTSTSLGANQPVHVAPNLDDDNDDDDERQAGNKPPAFVDPRDAIAAAYDARKKQSTGRELAPKELKALEDEELEDGDQEDGGDAEPGEVLILGQDGKPKPTADREPAQTRQVTQQQPTERREAQPRAEDDDAEEILTVDGVQVRMTRGEMRRNIQIGLGAERRLAEAKTILADARQVRDSSRTAAPADRSNQGDRAPREERTERPVETRRAEPPKIDPAKYVPLIQKIQLGDDAEAAAALVEAATDIAMQIAQSNGRGSDQGLTREAVREEVARSQALQAAQGEINEALEEMGRDHADVYGNKVLLPSMLQLGYQEAVKALKAIGVPDEDFNQPAQDVLMGYAELRQDQRYRGKLPALTDIYFDAANTVRKEIGRAVRERGQAADTGEVRREAPRLRSQAHEQTGGSRVVRTADSDRSGRKGRVVEQPRSGSIRADYTGAGGQQSKTIAEQNSDAIARMAKERNASMANLS